MLCVLCVGVAMGVVGVVGVVCGCAPLVGWRWQLCVYALRTWLLRRLPWVLGVGLAQVMAPRALDAHNCYAGALPCLATLLAMFSRPI